MITNLRRNTDDSFASLGSLVPFKIPEVYTFDSRSEAVCAIILEQYVPEWRIKRGNTWQIPLPFGKVADFKVNDTIIEFHPIDLKYEFKDPKAFWKFKTQLKSIPTKKAEKIIETIKAEKLAAYTHARKELLSHSRDLRHYKLEVCPNDKSFAVAVSNLINSNLAQEIYTDWRNYFETI